MLSFLTNTNPLAKSFLTLEGISVVISTLVNIVVQLGWAVASSADDLTKAITGIINGVIVVVFILGRLSLKKKMVEKGLVPQDVVSRSNTSSDATVPTDPNVPMSA